MSESSPDRHPPSSPEDIEWLDEIDRICDRFENEWTAGIRPALQEYIAPYSEQRKCDLLCELLPLELDYRQRQGEVPSADEYIGRFPQYADVIRPLLAPYNITPGLAVSPAGLSAARFRSVVTRASVLPQNTRVGNYELIEEIDRGGMGVVYKARQQNPERIVAVKMILSGALASEQEILRFKAEIRALANLRHPNIVPIYEVGTDHRQLFFSMAYIDGPNLARVLAQGPLPPREAARIIRIVASGVEFANSKGFIHRDLKPANIIFDETGIPHITDFGLTAQMGNSNHLTEQGQILGTPSFIPPEQARQSGEIGPRLDVYSLGAVLYMALTGRPPFQAATPLETIRQVLEEHPAPPHLLNADIPRDLEAICQKCLQKNPESRYASAAEFGGALQRFLNREPVECRTSMPFDTGRMLTRRAMSRITMGLALLGVLLFAFHMVSPPISNPPPQRRFTIIELGTLGGDSCIAYAINSSGQIVGTSATADQQLHAFLYQDGTMIDLGTLGGTTSTANAINKHGDIVGDATTKEGTMHAFLYKRGMLQDLGTLDGGRSGASAINDQGIIVGQARHASSGVNHAFLYDGEMHDLGTLGGSYSGASGINDLGQISGTSYVLDGSLHAFLYYNGKMTELGTLGGTSSVAECINASGQMAGYSKIRDDQAEHATAFQISPTATVTDLGTLGGKDSRANAINAAGQIVGTADTAQQAKHAFLYENGRMFDLNNMLSPADRVAWTLTSARGINDAGQIVGQGIVEQGMGGGRLRAFLLTPIVAGAPRMQK